MTLTLFKDHRYVRIINCKMFLNSCPLLCNGAWLPHTLKRSSTVCFCDWHVHKRHNQHNFYNFTLEFESSEHLLLLGTADRNQRPHCRKCTASHGSFKPENSIICFTRCQELYCFVYFYFCLLILYSFHLFFVGVVCQEQ